MMSDDATYSNGIGLKSEGNVINIEDGVLMVAAVALDIETGEPEANIASIMRCVRELKGTVDIAVFPELCTTGFINNRHDALALAEENSNYTVACLTELAVENAMAIAGSFLACDKEGRLYNRAFIIKGDGSRAFYDKRHLFILSPESKMYTAGDKEIPVVGIGGVKVALSVCYDLRFPAWLRNRELKYDMLLVPANWPQSRQHAWNTLLAARAIENQAMVVGADCSGHDNYGCYDDMAAIVDWNGEPVGQKTVIASQPTIVAAFDRAAFGFYRHKNPFYKSADSFELKTPSHKKC